jgi:hypothetical protein
MYITLCIYSIEQSTQFSYAVVDALSTTDKNTNNTAVSAPSLMDMDVLPC